MKHHVVLYTKPGCHLCEQALAAVNELRSEFSIVFAEINIELDPGLYKKYFDQIPVLIIDQRTTLTAPIPKNAIRAALSS